MRQIENAVQTPSATSTDEPWMESMDDYLFRRRCALEDLNDDMLQFLLERNVKIKALADDIGLSDSDTDNDEGVT